MKFQVILLVIFAVTQLGLSYPGKKRYKSQLYKDHKNDDSIVVPIAFKDDKETTFRKCGYEGCPKIEPNMINVHIVPHTHDDVGWLKTVDQYYYGSKTMIQKAGVQYILDSVIQSLLNDPEKRFIYVESEFFFKWWKHQTHELQERVKVLVNEGRLEFIGGAWSMNDEATTHYQSIIDQFTWGLRVLNDTFGECGRPRVGWQIDPFGHSREQASLFARMGFDGMFFGRLDYEDKRTRLESKNAEMVWKASPNLGESADLFTGVLYNNYGPPPGFCFDILCADEPIIDEKWSPDNNVNERVNGFFEYVKNMTERYRTNNVIITMGEDFNYQDANMWYNNLDKLIKYANERQKNGSMYNLFYSTPSCYLKSLHDADISWPTKSDDFFPYSSDPHAFWTGYFTSRPTLKRFERVGNQFLQICKQLTALAPSQEGYFESHLTFLRKQMGIMQHHDAVTGTEKQHVAADYARRLQVGIDACHLNVKSILNQFTTGKIENESTPNVIVNHHETKTGKPAHKNYTFEFSNCMELNISKCEISENSENFVVTLYNPLGYSTYQYVRVPVPDINYNVVDYKGVESPAQFVEIPESVLNLNYRFSSANYDLVFLANELPPMGYKSYYVSKNISPVKDEIDINFNKLPRVVQIQNDRPAREISFVPENKADVVIGNKYLNISFNANGFISAITTDGEEIPFTQNMYYYEGAAGDNRIFENRSSGAYIFRPNSTLQTITTDVKLFVTRGHLVDEVHQIFNEWVSQVVRVYKDENHVEFEWMVGPIPIHDDLGKEVVSKFSSNINSNNIFYTDSNGREMLKRVRNYRPTWDVHLQEAISGNYYPLTTKIALEDEKYRMAVLTDRAQGGTSLGDGEIEIMVHRRLLHDDAFGVGEALNEQAYGDGLIARGTHYLVFGHRYGNTNPSMIGRERFIQAKKLVSPWSFFSDVSSMSFDDWQNKYTHIRSGIALSLPANVHLLTFEPWRENQYLVRFEHILENDEDPMYSRPVKINLKDTFLNLPFNEIRETNVAGNQWIEDMNRLKFKEDKEDDITVAESIGGIPLVHHSRAFDFVSIDSVYVNNRGASSMQLNPKAKNLRDPEDYEITIKPMEIRTYILIFNQ